VRFFRSADRCIITGLRTLLAVGVLTGLSSPVAFSAQNEAPPGSATSPVSPSNAQQLSEKELEDFRNSMSRIPLPGKGCFTAQYPNKSWKKVECTPGPTNPSPLGRGGVRPLVVGNGTGYFAQAVGGNISAVIGSFDTTGTTGVTAEYGSRGTNLTIVYPNTYMLQINSNTFPTPLCGGVADCNGWQQFFFSQSGCNPGARACIYMQYWLVNHGLPCPDKSWTYYAVQHHPTLSAGML
jgi:hypothetical protein